MHDIAAVASTLDASSLRLSSRPRDLTDPAQGPHAVQRVLRAAIDALARSTCSAPIVDRGSASTAPAAALARALRGRAASNLLVARPRRVIDGSSRRHEVELWCLTSDRGLGLRDLGHSIGAVAAAVAPGFTISAVPGPAPYASDGRHVDARVRGAWVTIATGGVVGAALLARLGLPAGWSAVVLTLDLDRLVLLAKGMDDPSLLDAPDPAIARQMLDLEPFVPPAMARGARCAPPGRRVMLAVG